MRLEIEDRITLQNGNSLIVYKLNDGFILFEQEPVRGAVVEAFSGTKQHIEKIVKRFYNTEVSLK